MRKSIAIFFYFFLIISLVDAQGYFSTSVKYGFGYCGIINQNAYGFTELDPLKKVGNTPGIEISYNINERISFNTGFNYLNIGGKWEGEDKSIKTSRELDISYFQIPLSFKFSGKEAVRLYTSFGVGFDFLNKATQNYIPKENLATSPTRPDENGDISDRFNKSNLSGLFSLGIEYHQTPIFFSLGLCIDYGFQDINDPDYHIENKSGVYDPSNSGFGYISIGIGYFFFKKNSPGRTEL